MSCQRCKSTRVLRLQSHGRDCQNWSMVKADGKYIEGDGYLPREFGFGGDDDLCISVCLDCGQTQGTFPRAETEFEQQEGD